MLALCTRPIHTFLFLSANLLAGCAVAAEYRAPGSDAPPSSHETGASDSGADGELPTTDAPSTDTPPGETGETKEPATCPLTIPYAGAACTLEETKTCDFTPVCPPGTSAWPGGKLTMQCVGGAWKNVSAPVVCEGPMRDTDPYDGGPYETGPDAFPYDGWPYDVDPFEGGPYDAWPGDADPDVWPYDADPSEGGWSDSAISDSAPIDGGV